MSTTDLKDISLYEVETLTSSCPSEGVDQTLDQWKPSLSKSYLEKKTIKDRWFIKENKIFLRGPIQTNDYDYFKTLADKLGNKLKTINVISTGGETVAGSSIGEFIYNKNLTVEVAGPCLSSCANYIFGFAKHRVLLPQAFVGFHGNHTAVINESGGVDFFLQNLKPTLLEFYKKTEGKTLKSQDQLAARVEKRLIEVRENTLAVMARERKIYKAFGVPQSFFDSTQTKSKGYTGINNKVDFSFLYPEKSALTKLGFKLNSGDTSTCYAKHLFSKANKAPTSVLIAK